MSTTQKRCQTCGLVAHDQHRCPPTIEACRDARFPGAVLVTCPHEQPQNRGPCRTRLVVGPAHRNLHGTTLLHCPSCLQAVVRRMVLPVECFGQRGDA